MLLQESDYVHCLVFGLQGAGPEPSAREYTESEPASNSEAIRTRIIFFISGSFCAVCTPRFSTPGAGFSREAFFRRDSENVTESDSLRRLSWVVAGARLA